MGRKRTRPLPTGEREEDWTDGIEPLVDEGPRRIAPPRTGPASPDQAGVLPAAPGPAEGFDVEMVGGHVTGRAAGFARRSLGRLRRGEFEIEATLDLHGATCEIAQQRVEVFIMGCRSRGVRNLLIITGRGQRSDGGIGQLRRSLPEWLSTGSTSRQVLGFATARLEDGGGGAFYVHLRR